LKLVDAQSIGGWLNELASSAPAPGGGAAAALEVAIAAALVEMVCNLTIGKGAYVDHEPLMIRARDRAEKLRSEALALADADAQAFAAVIAAYKLPKQTDEKAQRRSALIEAALLDATEVPRRTATAASHVLDLCVEVIAGANPNVVSDLAASAAAARSALVTSLVNIEINRAALKGAEPAARLAAEMARVEPEIARADAIVHDVRRRIGP
jgi:formiminotetrahydrofolate cyclodeaminase